MVDERLQAIILAAGKSTRFNTGRTKLLETICGQEMILFPIKLLSSMNVGITVVVGYKQDSVKAAIKRKHNDYINFATQEKQLGTGHALQCSQSTWEKEYILVINGDAPLISRNIIEDLYKKHIQANATISFVTAHNPEPNSYGRVVRENNTIKIVEAREFDGDATEHCCINAGIYIIRREFLQEHINNLKVNSCSNEFYLTDLIKIASNKKLCVETSQAPFDQIRGINTLKELWAAEHIKRSELIEHWMQKGVRFSKAHTTHIDLNVTIESGTFIGQAVQLIGNTTIGKNCVIDPFSILENMKLKNNVTVHSHSILKDSHVEDGACIGPFAHIHSGSSIDRETIIGNFVEMKKSTVGQHSKAKHIVYLGDAKIGSNVTIGAGMITCNYDGKKKHTTIVKDGTFIGGNNSLVAPVTVGEKAFTAAGSVITEDVPDNALAIARMRQKNKEGYAEKLRTNGDRKEKEEMDKKNKDNNTPEEFIAAVKTHNDVSHV